MVKIKYVGAKKDGERAFKEKTGIEWFPGDVKDVGNEHAAEMLRHPDVFEAADAKATLSSAKAPAPTAQIVQTQNTGSPLAGLDDKQVKAFARQKGLSIPGLNVLKGDKLRAKVTAALAKA